MLLDLKGKSTLGELILSNLLSRYGTPETVEPHLGKVEEDVKKDFARLSSLCDTGECRSDEHHSDPSYFAHHFEDGHGRAYIGYSESLFDLLSEAEHCPTGEKCLIPSDVTLRPLPLTDRPAQPMVWVDMFVIDKHCVDACRERAVKVIHALTTKQAVVEQLRRHQDHPPRYLMPARSSVYANADLLHDAPLYPALRAIVEKGTAPTGRHWNATLRQRGSDLNDKFPQP